MPATNSAAKRKLVRYLVRAAERYSGVRPSYQDIKDHVQTVLVEHPKTTFTILHKDRASQELAEKFAARYVASVRSQLDMSDAHLAALGYIAFLLGAANRSSDQLRHALDMSDDEFVKFANRYPVEETDGYFGGALSK